MSCCIFGHIRVASLWFDQTVKMKTSVLKKEPIRPSNANIRAFDHGKYSIGDDGPARDNFFAQDIAACPGKICRNQNHALPAADILHLRAAQCARTLTVIIILRSEEHTSELQ